jgi:hypothetical protein
MNCKGTGFNGGGDQNKKFEGDDYSKRRKISGPNEHCKPDNRNIE